VEGTYTCTSFCVLTVSHVVLGRPAAAVQLPYGARLPPYLFPSASVPASVSVHTPRTPGHQQQQQQWRHGEVCAELSGPVPGDSAAGFSLAGAWHSNCLSRTIPLLFPQYYPTIKPFAVPDVIFVFDSWLLSAQGIVAWRGFLLRTGCAASRPLEAPL
jgi:hypothetical protein